MTGPCRPAIRHSLAQAQAQAALVSASLGPALAALDQAGGVSRTLGLITQAERAAANLAASLAAAFEKTDVLSALEFDLAFDGDGGAGIGTG